LGTSAAPVYFQPVKHEKNLLVDGGTYANNPAGIGFALAALKVKAENIKLLSVGTGQVDPNYKGPQREKPKKKK
jgi:patatin-like phospholipase/acyl hydrolase